MAQVQKETFKFLRDLQKNNHREWFQENKVRYQDALENMRDFADELLGYMQQHDVLNEATGKKSLHRIYRDTRFSKDKTPYKNNLSGSFSRATAARRGGYYFHMEPGNVFLGGGFWAPVTDDLKLIRSHIQAEPERFREVLEDQKFKSYFGELQGDRLKTSPKGYSAEDPAIDLLRYKQFMVSKSFTDKEVHDPGFAKVASDTFAAMRPFLDYMTEILTTDLNGISLIEE